MVGLYKSIMREAFVKYLETSTEKIFVCVALEVESREVSITK